MKTAIDYLLEILKEDNGVTMVAFESVVKQAKIIEKEQMRTAYFVGWCNKDLNFDEHYSSYYETERSNINI